MSPKKPFSEARPQAIFWFTRKFETNPRSCGIQAIFDLAVLSAFPERLFNSLPFNMTSPDEDANRPFINPSKLVFPPPLGPIRHTCSPDLISRPMESTAKTES